MPFSGDVEFLAGPRYCGQSSARRFAETMRQQSAGESRCKRRSLSMMSLLCLPVCDGPPRWFRSDVSNQDTRLTRNVNAAVRPARVRCVSVSSGVMQAPCSQWWMNHATDCRAGRRPQGAGRMGIQAVGCGFSLRFAPGPPGAGSGSGP